MLTDAHCRAAKPRDKLYRIDVALEHLSAEEKLSLVELL